MPPKIIIFNSDDSVLEYVRPVNEQKGVHIYRYTKSETKQDWLLPISEEQIERHIKDGIILTQNKEQ